jgi:hypothetical protein
MSINRLVLETESPVIWVAAWDSGVLEQIVCSDRSLVSSFDRIIQVP